MTDNKLTSQVKELLLQAKMLLNGLMFRIHILRWGLLYCYQTVLLAWVAMWKMLHMEPQCALKGWLCLLLALPES